MESSEIKSRKHFFNPHLSLKTENIFLIPIFDHGMLWD